MLSGASLIPSPKTLRAGATCDKRRVGIGSLPSAPRVRALRRSSTVPQAASPLSASAGAPAGGTTSVRTRLRGLLVGDSTRRQLFLVYGLWVLMVFDVDQFLSAKTGAPFYLAPTLLAPILTLLIISHGQRRVLYWPMVFFVAMHLVASFLAQNAGLSRGPLKFLLYMTLLFASTASFVNSPPKMTVILKLYLVSFAWFGLQGIPRGLVPWHFNLANEDSFGPLMVIAMPFAFFFGLAASSRRWRMIGHGIFALSILGLAASFARGASIAGAVVLMYIFALSPNKGRTLGYLAVAAIVLVPLAAALLPLKAYFAEVASSAQGDSGRMHIWSMAWRVFETSPLYGVGAGNFGVAAIGVATPAEIQSMWRGYYYLAVHNSAIQILAEEGLIGIALWLTMIVSFFRWNARLRTAAARAAWANQGGSELDLRLIARGLDGSMLGFLISGVFYNQMYIHWFWSMLTISFVLVRITMSSVPHSSGRPVRNRSVALPLASQST